MANHTMYTRAYSERSAGKLVSGKRPNGYPLSPTALLEEFRNHSVKSNPVATALVSCSDRIVDTLTRAFAKHYQEGESKADIWIAFIEVPPTTNETATLIHFAEVLAARCKRISEVLAEECKLRDPKFYSHEVVFEWAIPKEYVVHEVSLETLMKRGLQKHHFLPPSPPKVQPSTMDVRCYNARQFQQQDPWETGVFLGFFARTFGARAPLNWISYRLFYDCVWAKIVGDDEVRLKYEHEEHIETVDFKFLCDLDDGINTSLYDWWLSDIDFLGYEDWRDVTEDKIAWDLIELWETWHDVGCDGTVKELSTKEKLSYDRAKNELLLEYEKEKAAIEAEAVRIGL